MANALSFEQVLLLKILSSCVNKDAKINGGDFKNVSADSWCKIFLESKEHAVDLLVYDKICEIKEYVDEREFLELKKSISPSVKNNAKVSYGQSEIVKLLEKNGFSYIIIKGASSSSYYDKPSLRLLGDVDILINKEDTEKIAKVLIENGYNQTQNDHPSHVGFEKKGVTYELHFEVAGIPYGKVGEKLRAYLKENAFRETLEKNDGLSNFNAPSDFTFGIILILHTVHHMLGEGLGLRHFLDFATFVSKTKEQPFWTKELLPLLKDIGLLVFTLSMVKTACAYLGVDTPSWCDKVCDEIEDEIILDVLSSGNFGRKDLDRASSGMLISEHGKDGTKNSATYNLSHSLHVAVLRMPIVKKCIILYPFVYLYKSIKFLFLSLIGKRPSVIKMKNQAKERKIIYDKLKVFQTENGEK